MQIDLYLDNKLDDSVAIAHLQECQTCKRQIEEHRSNNLLLRQITDSMTGSFLHETLQSGESLTSISIDGYEIQREIRRGAQGIVFEAVQLAAKRKVALKLLLSGAFATTAQRRRFEREIELVAGLDHPGIVTVFDSGVTQAGQLYFAMQYVDGITLDQWTDCAITGSTESKRDVLRQCLNVQARICQAVHHAHLHGIIHRDLKPGNILIDSDDQPHVLDFGLAKPFDPETIRASQTVTQAGQFMGTIAYAAPEQTRGDPTVIDVRSDVYALGVILYEMLSGTLPIEPDADLRATLRAIVELTPVPPSHSSTTALPIDRDLDTIVMTALAKDRPRRYQSAQALLEDIEHYLNGEPIDTRRDSSLYVLRKNLVRHRIALSIVTLFVLLLVGFSISMSILYQRATIEADKVKQINLFLEDTLGSVEPMTPGQAVTVREMLDEAAQWIDIALSDQPEVQAAIHTTIGNGYRALGLYDRSNYHFTESLRIRRDLFGEHHAQVAQSLNAMALLRHSEGRLEEAQQLFEDALRIREDVLGHNTYEVSLTHANLARVYRDMEEFDQSEHHIRTSLAVRRELFGNTHQDVAMCQFSLGQLEVLRGENEKAIVLHQQAYATRMQILHRDHPDLERSQHAIGTILLELDRTEEALPFLQKSHSARVQRLGSSHWHTALSACLLGEALLDLGRHEDSQRLVAPAESILSLTLGADDTRTQHAKVLLQQSETQDESQTPDSGNTQK